MYSQIKTILKSIIPKKLWHQYEATFRSMVYLYHKGNNFKCNICEAKLKSFIHLANKDLLCPRCGSLPRTRRLYSLLTIHQFLNGQFLHFSPPKSLYKKLSTLPSIQYLSSDFENEFLATYQFDLTNIDLGNNTIDNFIAYHVLEHIEADQQAIKELYRITKKGGKGLIQTPFKKGSIYEDFSIQSPEERLLHFGQADHVRIYNVKELQSRLESAGFKVTILSFTTEANNHYGFKTSETVLLVKK
ncbi:MAG: methyltransferase domain-containing protein [Saprospiraceae bacterium]